MSGPPAISRQPALYTNLKTALIQDLRTRLHKRLNEHLLKQLPQAGCPLLLVCLINRLACSPGMLAERHPSQVAAGQVVALGMSVAALALFSSRQLL